MLKGVNSRPAVPVGCHKEPDQPRDDLKLRRKWCPEIAVDLQLDRPQCADLHAASLTVNRPSPTQMPP